jgi:hypothetical protein
VLAPRGRDHGAVAATRVALAQRDAGPAVDQLMAAAGLGPAPGQLLLRVFKRERLLEVWASDTARGPLVPVVTYPICAASGHEGPKTREGDGQVPEGLYALDLRNAQSAYWLSLRIDYPNASDRRRARTGSAIMIHGGCASIGCVAIGDAAIEELWVLTGRLRGAARPQVHAFPRRAMAEVVARARAAGDEAALADAEALALVEREVRERGLIPDVAVGRDGRLLVASRPEPRATRR